MFATPHVGFNGSTFDLTEVISPKGLKFGSANGAKDALLLWELIRSVQSYLLSSNLQCNFFTDAVSIAECLELPESCAGAAGGCNPWSNVDFSNKYQNSRKNGEVS